MNILLTVSPTEAVQLLNGLVVAKCEITDNPIQGVKDIGNATYIRMYGIRFSSLTVFDKPMELHNFYVKDYDIFNTDSNGKEVNPYKQPIPLHRAPSRWQYVEVGE